MNIKKVILGGAGMLGILGAVIGLNSLQTKNSIDPLEDIISSTGISFEYPLSADFITSSIDIYSGPTNPQIEICKNSIQLEEPIGKIFASYNPTANITQTIDEIRDEINPIFGYAVRNNQINWIWDVENKEYTFYSAIGDEAFWKCYFIGETDFFSEFFIPESVSIPGEIPYGDKTIITLSADPFFTSTSEANRNISIPRQEAINNGAILGFVHIDPPLNQYYSHSFFNAVDEIPQKIELNSGNIITSTVEVMRNVNYPFISLHITSTREEERINAVNAVEDITITKLDENPLYNLLCNDAQSSDNEFDSMCNYEDSNIKNYKIIVNLNNSVPINVDYGIEIDPLFLSPSDNSEILFMGSRRGPAVSFYDEEFCTEEYNPVCGKPNFQDCFFDPSGKEICSIPPIFIENITYSNMCNLEKEGADFLYDGECSSPPTDYPTPFPPTPTYPATPIPLLCAKEGEYLVEVVGGVKSQCCEGLLPSGVFLAAGLSHSKCLQSDSSFFTLIEILEENDMEFCSFSNDSPIPIEVAELCNDFIKISPNFNNPLLPTDSPITYYSQITKKRFYCGGNQPEEFKDSRCSMVLQCESPKYSLCQK